MAMGRKAMATFMLLGTIVVTWGAAAESSTSLLSKIPRPSSTTGHSILSQQLQHLLDSATAAAGGGGDDDGDECYLPPRSTVETRCSIIQRKEACTDIRALVDYLDIIYCRMGSSWGRVGAVMGTVVLLAWLLLLMSLMGSTADNFFVQPLTLLSDYLKLSPAVAGCTLLAYGNGAPDIFTAHAAIGSQGDLPLVLSALLGAALLVITCVLASVILTQKEPLSGVSRSSLFRDVIFYLSIVITTVVICYDGVITLWESCAFIGAYLIYTLAMVFKHRKHVRKTRSKKAPVVLPGPFETYRIPFLLEFSAVETESWDSDVEGHPILQGAHSGERTRKRMLSDYAGLSDESSYVLLHEDEAHVPGLALGHGWMENVQIVAEYPFTLLRHLTTPLIDKSWGPKRRTLACIWPVPFGILLTISVRGIEGLSLPINTHCPVPVWCLLLLLGPILSAACYYLTRGGRRPPGWLKGALAIIAFISAMLWMNLLAGEIVSVVESFGAMLNISSGILGVTVVAMSNSLGDWVANVAVARKGHGAMSVAACFGAPVLNDLLGIGISLTAYCLRTGSSYQVNLSDHSYQQVKLIWSFLLPTLLLALLAFPLTCYSPGKPYAILLLVIYGLFLLMAIMTELKLISLPW